MKGSVSCGAPAISSSLAHLRGSFVLTNQNLDILIAPNASVVTVDSQLPVGDFLPCNFRVHSRLSRKCPKLPQASVGFVVVPLTQTIA